METECGTEGTPVDVVTYHFGFEPRRPGVAGYNQQPKRKDVKDSVHISADTKPLPTTFDVFFY